MHDITDTHSWPKPEFTLQQLKAVIPKHCLERSFITSTYHLLVDLWNVFSTLLFMHYITPMVYESSILLWLIIWSIYVPFQGVNMMACWVLAHECGHGAMYNQEWLNDIIGYVLHTVLYVPYFPWKYTHAVHHRYTNNLEKDQVWVPDVATNNELQGKQLLEESKITSRNIIRILLVSILGWPMYLFTNYGAAKTKESNNHFTYCEMFHSKPKWKILASTYGLILWTILLLYLSFTIGIFKIFGLYFLPYLIVNFFLVTITFLQHKDERIPHMSDSNYDWLRNATCTIDRTMGSYLDEKLHLIHVTHVCHHLFPYIPFYHSRKVTEVIKPILGKYYVKEDGNYWIALWENYKYWGTIENNNHGVYWRFKRD